MCTPNNERFFRLPITKWMDSRWWCSSLPHVTSTFFALRAGRSWQSQVRKWLCFVGNIWETYGNHIGNIWETYGKHMGNIWETWWLIKGNRFIPNKNQTNPYKHRYGYSARNAETPHWLLGNIFQICKFPQIMWNQVESDLGLPGYRKMVVFMRTWPFKQMIKINMYIYIIRYI